MSARSTIPGSNPAKRIHQISVRLSDLELAALHERVRQIRALQPEVAGGSEVRSCRTEAIRAAIRLWMRTDVCEPRTGRVLIAGAK